MIPRMSAPAQRDLRARIIANPASGGARDQRVARRTAAGLLAELGWTIDWRETEGRGDATRLATEAADRGYDVVIAVGGDGTVHEVVHGLVGSRTALAVLPAGTANVLAAQLGLMGVPSTLHRANLPAVAEALARGAPRAVDLGWARPRGGRRRHFLLWAGVGLDAAVAREIETEARDLKRLLGPAAFGAVGLRRTALGGAGAEAVVRLDAQRVRDELLLAVVSNISLYAGAIQLAPEARLDDGLLNVALFRGQNILRALRSYFGGDVRTVVQHLSALLTGRVDDSRPITAPARRVRVVAREALPVHLDGEPFCETPVTIGVAPLALRLWVPPTAPDRLFSTELAAEPQDADVEATGPESAAVEAGR